MILKLYYLGEVVHEEPIDLDGTIIFEQREARVLRARQWLRDRYKQGLLLSNKWEVYLEAGSRMNSEDFKTDENEVPHETNH